MSRPVDAPRGSAPGAPAPRSAPPGTGPSGLPAPGATAGAARPDRASTGPRPGSAGPAAGDGARSAGGSGSSGPTGSSGGPPSSGRAGTTGPGIPPPSAGERGLPPYTLLRRLTDWRRARADGRAGLPSPDPGRPQGTPALEELAQDFLARSHRERLRLDVELAPLLESAAALGVRIEELDRTIERSRERLEQWPVLPDEAQLGRRRGGEAMTRDDVVRARRAREYEGQRRPLADELARLERAASTAREELARTRAAVRAREVVGATRVRRLHAQVMRRISTYERHLVRHHPAGDRVGPLLVAQHPRIPGWVFDAEDPHVPPSAATPAAPFPTAGRPHPSAPDDTGRPTPTAEET